MVTGTGTLATLVWPGIKSVYGIEYKQYPALYSQFFTKEKSTQTFERMQGVTSLPLAGIKEEGGDLPFVGISQAFQKDYTNVTYAIGTVVTREMMEDEKYGVIKKLPKLLAQSMYQTEETIAHNVLNNGFTTEESADGSTVFSTTHPLAGQAGGTEQNTLTTAADLNQSSLEQALIDISDLVDDQSLKLRCYAKTLVVPTASQWIAEKILKTNKEVGSADNTMNPMSNQNIKLVVSPYLTDNDAWFLVTDCPEGLTFFTRREADVDRDNDFDSHNLKFSSSKRYSVGVTNFRGVYGVAGT